METVLKINNLCFSYGDNKILKGLNAAFEKGKLYAVKGRSGSGKTTLLSLIAGLMEAESGTIEYCGKNIKKIDRNNYRSREIGMIFQSYNLLFNYTASENIILSLNISGNKEKDKKAAAQKLLNSVGLDSEKAARRVLKLSGGEQQRVAIARCLAYNPNLIIADEPTGNLDEETEQAIMEIFLRLTREENKTVIIVTHSSRVSSFADKILRLDNGCFIE